ncbi:sugar isomerase domain-containing protein [Cohnella silvisoli]|uniref:UPF0309 protein QJS35_14505 n=1 Tax=Cohnella silvisoli TaxID=2873699 RepID=A0ABV1KUW3_9BACL|nr:SIS domain-containing protein [Cohnella silvisoli]MCD9023227.1 SIS domain-containing protein [Cohnella silvisoli]
MLIDQYLQKIAALTEAIGATQSETIRRVASLIADSVEKGGVLHVFGSGHSHMIAEDVFHRAGGLACVNAMLEPSLMELNVGRATELERLSGYAKVLLSGYDLRAGEVIVVISNSGINAVPIEVALECRERGLHVIALTNMDHSRQAASRHHSGVKLFEVADLVLDNCGVYGDAVLQLEHSQQFGPTSTIGGLIVMQSVAAAVVDELIKRKMDPPIFLSANREGGDEHNGELFSRYKDRVRYA